MTARFTAAVPLIAAVMTALVVAQAPAVVLVSSGGGRPVAVARWEDGRWVDAGAKCLSGPAAQLRVTVTGTGLTAQAPLRVAQTDAEWRTLAPVVRQTFEARERGQRLTREGVAAAPIEIGGIYGAADGAARVLYFDASRSVPDTSTSTDPDVDPKGVLRVDVSGWLRSRDGRVTSLGSSSDLHWDQVDERGRTPAADAAPIGILRRGDAMTWMLAARAGNAFSLSLIDIDAARVRSALRLRVSAC